ncbi:MAG: hypothetical protein IKA41_02450 [Bacteroidaceae bacterium]|nr:hypothetical protein [Bacteroidaceae bacterium]
MACECEYKKRMSNVDIVSDLARKVAIMEQSIYVVYRKEDGTYSFCKLGEEINGTIIEYRHYL